MNVRNMIGLFILVYVRFVLLYISLRFTYPHYGLITFNIWINHLFLIYIYYRVIKQFSIQVGSAQVSFSQVGSTQVGSSQVGSAQVGSDQVGFAQVGSD